MKPCQCGGAQRWINCLLNYFTASNDVFEEQAYGSLFSDDGPGTKLDHWHVSVEPHMPRILTCINE